MKRTIRMVCNLLPAMGICGLYCLIFVVSQSPLRVLGDIMTSVTGLYILLPLLASVLLCLEYWWGSLPGMAAGALIVYVYESNAGGWQHVNVDVPVGMVLIAAYAALGLWTFLSTRKKKKCERS